MKLWRADAAVLPDRAAAVQSGHRSAALSDADETGGKQRRNWRLSGSRPRQAAPGCAQQCVVQIGYGLGQPVRICRDAVLSCAIRRPALVPSDHAQDEFPAETDIDTGSEVEIAIYGRRLR